MYSTVPHLQTAIRAALQKGPVCRIYQESLRACWPHLSEEDRMEQASRLAVQHHWTVEFRELGSLGLVAEFHKQEVGAQAA